MLKKAPMPWFIYVMTASAALTMIMIIVYGYTIGARMSRIDAPLVNLAMKLRLEASIADLMFEELLSGGIVGDIDDAWDRLDYGLEDLLARLSLADRGDGIFQYLGDLGIRRDIAAVEKKLNALKTILHERFENKEISMITGRADLRYRSAFSEFMQLLNKLETKVVRAKELNQQRFQRTQIIMICLVLFISLLVGTVLLRFERNRARAYLRIQEYNRKLALEMTERKKAEDALKEAYSSLENKVEERTAELTAVNDSLKKEICERMRTTALLEQHKIMLQAVFDGISDPLMLVDRNMLVKTVNEAAARGYGLQKEDFMAEAPCYQVAGFDGPCKGCRIPGAVKECKKINFERKGVFNPERLELVTIYPITDENETTGEAVVHVSDITEKRMIERSLMQKEKMAALGFLVANVAHEINNPNSFVSFNIPILKEYINEMISILDDYTQKHPQLEIANMPYEIFNQDILQLIENIKNGSDRIDSFVSKLREYSKGEKTIKLKALDVRQLVEQVVSQCRSNMLKTVQSVLLEIPDAMPHMMTDPYCIQQILLNIFLNAAQASNKEDSWVRLAVNFNKEEDSTFTFEISDNGCGFDQETKERIFDPFFTTKKLADGSGLGLYICHNLMEDLGGRIEAESNPGVGSTFRLIFPNAAAT